MEDARTWYFAPTVEDWPRSVSWMLGERWWALTSSVLLLACTWMFTTVSSHEPSYKKKKLALLLMNPVSDKKKNVYQELCCSSRFAGVDDLLRMSKRIFWVSPSFSSVKTFSHNPHCLFTIRQRTFGGMIKTNLTLSYLQPEEEVKKWLLVQTTR